MLLNFLETNLFPFENKINWRIKSPKYLSTNSSFPLNKKSIDNKFLLYSINKKYELIKLILFKRSNAILCIQRNLKKYLIKKQIKVYCIIKEIIIKREKSILMIEKHIKSFLIRKHFKSLLKNDALFLYDFSQELINQICIFSTFKEQFL